MNTKPVIFISHSSEDKNLAKTLRQQILQGLDDFSLEDIFVSSAPDSIDAGAVWFKNVISNLKKTEALIVLVTPNSQKSNWVWFEIGYYWTKRKKHIYPLFIPGTEILHPLNEHQAKSLESQVELRVFFEALCKQFNGNPDKVNLSTILEAVSVVAPKLSDSDIKALLNEYMEKYESAHFILYDELDNQLSIPKESSRFFLKEIAHTLNWKIKKETENGIQFYRDSLLTVPFTGLYRN